MRKGIAVLLSALLAAALFFPALPARADNTEYVSGDYVYTVSDGKATIVDYIVDYYNGGTVGYDSKGSISIPSTLDGYPVVAIGDYAFADLGRLTGVIIPNGVTRIGNYAFYVDYDSWYNPSYLTEITIPPSIHSIGMGAFPTDVPHRRVYITDLVAWCNFGSSHTGGDLYLNNQLVQHLEIPKSVTKIDSYSFYGCTSITDVIIPDTVTDIGQHAFAGCSNLENVTIPGSVTDIGYGAFENCESLTGVYINSLEAWCNIRQEYANPLSNGGDLYLNNQLVQHLEIPKSVTKINPYSFNGCSSITDAIISDTVTDIGYHAFAGCSNLENVTIPNSVTDIGSGAFENCNKLRITARHDSYAYQYALNNGLDYYLISAPVPNAPVVESISGTTVAIKSCNGYEYKCDNREWQKSNIFTDLPPEQEITFYQRLAATDNNVASEISAGTIVTTSKNTLQAPAAPVLEEVTHTSVVLQPHDGYEYRCGDGAWQTNNVFTGLLKYTEYTFYQRIAETESNFASEPSDGVIIRTLSENICDTCMGSGEVSVDGTCYFCSGSGQVVTGRKCTVCGSSNVTEYVVGIGGSIGMICNVCGGPGRAVYGTCSHCDGSGYASQPAPCPDCEGTGVRYEYTVTDDGTAAITDYHGTDGDITIPAILDGHPVTAIGYSAFSDCDFLTSVIIPNSVTSIGSYAFSECSQLTSIVIPNSITKIDSYTFQSCPRLTNIVIPNSVTHIGSKAFSNCSGLTSIRIPDSVTYIGGGAFYGCDGLQEITIPYVGCEPNMPENTYFAWIFAYDPDEYKYDNYKDVPASLKKVTITGGTRIWSEAFVKCTSIEEVVITEGAKPILSSIAFVSCTNLKSVSIPRSVTDIEGLAFWYCDLLTIKGYAGTAAEQFAQNQDIPFEYLTYELVAPGTGDVDGSGTVDISDVMAACKILARDAAGSPPTAAEILAADVDGSGTVNIQDIMGICRILARQSA